MKKLNLKTASFVVVGIGLLALLRATFFDTAPMGTHNTGLMQVQMLWAQFASTLLVIGALLFVGDHLADSKAVDAHLEGQ